MNKELYFIAGGVLGGLCGFFFARKYYRWEKEEELKKQKEFYEGVGKKEEAAEAEAEKQQEEFYEEVKKELRGYSTAVNDQEEALDKDEVFADKPFVISPEEYADGTFYEEVNLTWYEQDGVLTRDEWNEGEYESEVVTDIGGLVGYEWQDRFGEFEENTVYVRDERNSTDYIITREVTAYEID